MSKQLLSLAFLAFLVLGVVVYSYSNRATRFGGGVSEDYNVEYVNSLDASSTVATVLKTGRGTLGSVVVTVPAGSGSVFLYDSASSTATTSTDTILGFAAASDVPATYSLDGEFSTGLTLEVTAGFDGQYVVTWR
jgi:hypothetical protein